MENITFTQIQEFLNKLTHQQRVNLSYQLIDYIATELYFEDGENGETITIITNESPDDGEE